jgi:hypothetical protein
VVATDVVDAIERFVEAPSAGGFDALALRAFSFQFENVDPYRRWCERTGATPAEVRDWRHVPWVPASALKSVALHAAPAVLTFRSSGTTAGERRSVHHHPFPHLYRRVIDRSFPEFCLPRRASLPMLSLIPGFEPARESSLSFMIDHVLARFGADGSANVVGPDGIDHDRARAWLAARERDRRPALLLTTALALDQLLRGLERSDLRLRPAPGSALFVTGGFKTRQAELTLDDLLERLEDRLGIGRAAVVQEYGMTELTSQAYTRSLDGPPHPNRGWASGANDLFVCPPWMRVRVLDPISLEEAAAGATGLLAVFDLGNVGSVLHLLTEDLGRIEDGGFRLLGRASGAELRGCSLTAEELEEASPDRTAQR